MKMPTIVGIFIIISRESFMLSWVEHWKKFYNLGTWHRAYVNLFVLNSAEYEIFPEIFSSVGINIMQRVSATCGSLIRPNWLVKSRNSALQLFSVLWVCSLFLMVFHVEHFYFHYKWCLVAAVICLLRLQNSSVKIFCCFAIVELVPGFWNFIWQ